MDRELLSTYGEGPDRHHRLRRRRGPDPAAARPVRRGARGRGRVPGHLRRGELLLRDHGPRPRHRAPGHRATCCGWPRTSACRCVATNDLHYTHAARRQGPRGAAVRAVRLDPRRPEPVQVRRRTSSTSRAPEEMRPLFREHPEACDNTLLIAERCEVSFEHQRPTCRASRARRARPRPAGSSRRSSAGLQRPLPRRACRTAPRTQADYEVDVIIADGLPRLLPRRRRLHQLGQGQRHPRRPGPWLGRRLAWPRTPWASPTSTRSSTA